MTLKTSEAVMLPPVSAEMTNVATPAKTGTSGLSDTVNDWPRTEGETRMGNQADAAFCHRACKYAAGRSRLRSRPRMTAMALHSGTSHAYLWVHG